MSKESIDVFLSYSYRDRVLVDQLEAHLTALKWRGEIRTWSDRQIEVGAEWGKEIKAHLDSADIIILLVSPDYLASDFSFEEAERALERHKTGEARVIPVLLRPVDFMSTPLAELQASPEDRKPISLWENKDKAFLSVVKDIRKTVEELSLQASANDS
jgi:TIR domain